MALCLPRRRDGHCLPPVADGPDEEPHRREAAGYHGEKGAHPQQVEREPAAQRAEPAQLAVKVAQQVARVDEGDRQLEEEAARAHRGQRARPQAEAEGEGRHQVVQQVEVVPAEAHVGALLHGHNRVEEVGRQRVLDERHDPVADREEKGGAVQGSVAAHDDGQVPGQVPVEQIRPERSRDHIVDVRADQPVERALGLGREHVVPIVDGAGEPRKACLPQKEPNQMRRAAVEDEVEHDQSGEDADGILGRDVDNLV